MTKSIADFTKEKCITEVLHFTRDIGMLGILASDNVLSRARVDKDDYLKHIYEANAPIDKRTDRAYLDYVNLSITRVNGSYFGISRHWHREKENWWCVLSFDPEILTHEGVLFVPTNNKWSGARNRRIPGIDGLRALFAPEVHQWVEWDGRPVRGKIATRTPAHSPNLPTCIEAEALYPGQLSTKHLRRVYTASDEHAATIAGWCAANHHAEFPIDVNPEVFK